MKPLIDYVNDLFNKFGSDYRIEKELGLAKGAVYKIKHRHQCGKKTAIKIADALGVNREELIIAAEMARCEGTIKKAMEKISRNAALTMNSFIALGVMRPALNHVATAIVESMKCILCKIVKFIFFAKFKNSFPTDLINYDILHFTKRSRIKPNESG